LSNLHTAGPPAAIDVPWRDGKHSRMGTSRTRVSPALRHARRGWRLQFLDAAGALALAERALQLAAEDGDLRARCWARLVRGLHLMRTASAAEASGELQAAQAAAIACGDRSAQILAEVGLARCEINTDRAQAALARLLPLRSEGLRLLRHLGRAMLLNGIAGCFSALGDSAEAFAYMYQALREARHVHRQGFDVVLYCNIAHELCQLGDYEEALRYLHEGLDRCDDLRNGRLRATLMVNRIVCLTDLDRARQALPDIERLLALPGTDGGAGVGYESLAIAALRGGAQSLGDELVERARSALGDRPVVDARYELAVAQAEQAAAHGDPARGAHLLASALPLPDTADGLSLRVRSLFLHTWSELLQRCGDAAAALEALRQAQQLQVARARLALRARSQASMLQTELLRLQRERDGLEARRRAAERARAQLAAINRQLSLRVEEVQRLQAALAEQAVRDFLTGLYNRRHLSEVLPSMLALAHRTGEPLAVVVIDLDHFKAVNDRHGHATGDRLLQGFGALVRRSLRRSDIACRYGGEEFCLLLPKTGAHAARRKVDALRRQWRELRFEVDGRLLTGNSFSAGIADSVTAEHSADALLKAADDCALDAKRRGRNQSVVFSAARLAAGGDRAPVAASAEGAR
jgi:diguanylate cyclase (GGDEF)-like protein